MGGEAGRAPSGGLRSCACSRTGWGRHHHHGGGGRGSGDSSVDDSGGGRGVHGGGGGRESTRIKFLQHCKG